MENSGHAIIKTSGCVFHLTLLICGPVSPYFWRGFIYELKWWPQSLQLFLLLHSWIFGPTWLFINEWAWTASYIFVFL